MNPLLTKHTAKAALAAAALLAIPHHGEAALVSYYIGVDGMQTIGTGEFTGMANPNANRLTFLYAHPDEETPANSHYHSKGIFRYQPGTGASPVIDDRLLVQRTRIESAVRSHFGRPGFDPRTSC